MQTKRSNLLLVAWLLLSVLLAAFLYVGSEAYLLRAVEAPVREHLELTLDESHFSSAQNRENDRDALQKMGQQINAALEGFVSNRWYSPLRACRVSVLRVDNVVVEDTPVQRSSVFELLRNQIEREVSLGLSCSPNGWLAVSVSGLLGVLFALIYRLFPPPLSRVHRRWINYLVERGYSGSQAFDIVRQYDSSRLSLSSAQLNCLEQLHNSEQGNFTEVINVVTDERVAPLDDLQVDWLLLGLRGDPANLNRALDLALAEESVIIDLNDMTLQVRGLGVPMSRTPLFYYAWYAMNLEKADGWVTNPASNRPDLVAGQDLARFMQKFEGHAKAINDLEQTGLKARTLDQNRSKIKEDMVDALGEKLASTCLFEASKHPDGVHTRYRLRGDANCYQIIA